MSYLRLRLCVCVSHVCAYGQTTCSAPCARILMSESQCNEDKPVEPELEMRD